MSPAVFFTISMLGWTLINLLIEHNQTEIVKIDGTKITVYTGIELEAYKSEFLQIVLDFFRFSPHMSITTHGFCFRLKSPCTNTGLAEMDTSRTDFTLLVLIRELQEVNQLHILPCRVMAVLI